MTGDTSNWCHNFTQIKPLSNDVKHSLLTNIYSMTLRRFTNFILLYGSMNGFVLTYSELIMLDRCKKKSILRLYFCQRGKIIFVYILSELNIARNQFPVENGERI